MILVDTSILIPYLKGADDIHTKKIEYLINNNITIGINKFIYLEVLQGVSNINDFNILRDSLIEFKFYDLLYELKSYEEVARKYFMCRKQGITIRSTIDILIAQTAIENQLLLYHNDKDFNFLAEVFPELTFFE